MNGRSVIKNVINFKLKNYINTQIFNRQASKQNIKTTC